MIKPQHAEADFAYLTTVGRRTGDPHTVEIWFAVGDGTFYLLSGGGERSDWCRNLAATPEASFRVARTEYAVTGRRVTSPAEQKVARSAVFSKYQGSDGDLTEWRDAAVPYALDLR